MQVILMFLLGFLFLAITVALGLWLSRSILLKNKEIIEDVGKSIVIGSTILLIGLFTKAIVTPVNSAYSLLMSQGEDPIMGVLKFGLFVTTLSFLFSSLLSIISFRVSQWIATSVDINNGIGKALLYLILCVCSYFIFSQGYIVGIDALLPYPEMEGYY